jgi:FKBP-type peptidyl-prolyl cis-trans isomerase (trigger factor)
MSPNVKTTSFPVLILTACDREELERRMDEFARKYTETHDKEIVEALYRLARELEKLTNPKFLLFVIQS